MRGLGPPFRLAAAPAPAQAARPRTNINEQELDRFRKTYGTGIGHPTATSTTGYSLLSAAGNVKSYAGAMLVKQ